MTARRKSIAVAVLVAAGTGWCSSAFPLPVSITTPFLNFENDNINSDGFSTGHFLRFGATVTPNGAHGTTGIATTVDTATNAAKSFGISFVPSPLLPNFFERKIPVNTNWLGPYTLKFTNGTDSASAMVSLPGTAAIAPFVQSITLSGTSLNPTFSWAPPAGALVNGYRLNIIDKSLINLDPKRGPLNSGQVTNLNVAPNVTSHTVTAADFTVPNYAFTPGKNYSIEIDILQTRDGLSTHLGNGNLASISRSYADFTPNVGGGPPVNLPVVLANGVFQFNMAVVSGRTYYIDPAAATGYDYQIGAGDPTFASVVLPSGIAGRFKLWEKDAHGKLVFVANLAGGQVFEFGAGGVSFFEVTGIDPRAALDPGNPTAFVTGLTFENAGTFDGTQTALSQTVANVPEPTTLALTGLGLLAVVAASRRRTPRGAGRTSQ
ncbi:MAG: PEP-CTERM sorting domain-containing protein [Pseudomonadota bacterium]|nr:PEP-CTERM sorting domain-containing protein [Pseudomonadota bacterium]